MMIVHLIAGLPRAGGMSELVPLLALEQSQSGHVVSIVTVGEAVSEAVRRAESGGVRIIACPANGPANFFFSRDLFRRLPRLVGPADVVHVHGCWTIPVWWGCRAAVKAGKHLVRSPHGCLAPERLRISRWKKVLAWRVFERRYFLRSAVIHVTCEAERADVARVLKFASSKDMECGVPEDWTGGPEIKVVPLGVDEKAFAAQRVREALDLRWPSCVGKRVALCLSRLHPLKGIDLLLEAWGRLESRDGWHLLIAGPDEKETLAALTAQVQRLGIEGCVTFSGPVYGAEKFACLAGVDLFVLPTRNENFGIVVAEALACGVPVITTRGAPWSELLGSPARSEVPKCASSKMENAITANDANQTSEENFRTSEFLHVTPSPDRCGWWVDIDVEPLADAIREAMSLTDEDRRRMGAHGRELAARKYRWNIVAKQMSDVYRSLLESVRPSPRAVTAGDKSVDCGIQHAEN